MNIRRAAAITVIAAALGLSLGIGVVAPANAVTSMSSIDPSLPNPISVLPSNLKSTYVPPIGGGISNAYALMLAGVKDKDSAFWKLVAKQQAGEVLTAQETAAVSKGKSTTRWALTKPQALLKGVGGAATVMSGYDMGVNLGNGVLDVLGIDHQGLICNSFGDDPAGKFVQIMSKNDCSPFRAADGYNANAGVNAGYQSAKLCNTVGANTYCAQITGTSTFVENGTQYPMTCVTLTGPNTSFPGYLLLASGKTSVGSSKWIDGANILDNACGKRIAGNPWTGSAKSNWYWITSQSGAVDPIVGMSFKPVPQGGSYTPVTQGSTNPDRKFVCVVVGSDGVTYTGESQSFTENDPVWSPPKCPRLPDGVFPTSIEFQETGEATPHIVQKPEIDPSFTQATKDYPECMSGTCMLDLISNATGSCFTAPAGCADWFADPKKNENYTCKYGTHAVELAECSVYAPTFKPGAKAADTPYADPKTGDTPKVDPNTGNGSSSKESECFPKGWGVLNPIEWVAKPVGCALSAAFVPRATEVDKRMEAIKTRWGKTQPAKLIAATGAIAPALSTLQDGGCGGILIDLHGIAPDIIPKASGRFLPACQGDFFFPWAIGVKVLLMGSITFAGFFAIKAQTSRLVGLSGSA